MKLNIAHDQEHSEVWRRNFGARLKAERKRLGLTQADFADLGGVKRVSQHLYEAGGRVPTSEYMQRIGANGVRLSYLMGVAEPADDGSLVSLRVDQLADIYRLVDQRARDASGQLASLPERLQLFQLCCVAFSGTPVGVAEMDKKLVQLSGVARR